MAKVKIRKGGNRSGGGRPARSGDRYPGGKLKPQKPNPEVIARRQALTEDITMATCPLDVAYARNWLSRQDYGAARAYISVHSRAGLGGPGARQADTSLPTGAALDLAERWSGLSDSDVRKLDLTLLPDKELVLIWDSALRDLGRMADPEKAEQFAAEATRRWRALNAAMTSIERLAVDSFCIRETWPRWLSERLAGRMDSRWEDERRILVSGLKVMAAALAKPKTIARVDLVAPQQPPVGPRRRETFTYVDQDGGKLFEVERIATRRP